MVLPIVLAISSPRSPLRSLLHPPLWEPPRWGARLGESSLPSAWLPFSLPTEGVSEMLRLSSAAGMAEQPGGSMMRGPEMLRSSTRRGEEKTLFPALRSPISCRKCPPPSSFWQQVCQHTNWMGGVPPEECLHYTRRTYISPHFGGKNMPLISRKIRYVCKPRHHCILAILLLQQWVHFASVFINDSFE